MQASFFPRSAELSRSAVYRTLQTKRPVGVIPLSHLRTDATGGCVESTNVTVRRQYGFLSILSKIGVDSTETTRMQHGLSGGWSNLPKFSMDARGWWRMQYGKSTDVTDTVRLALESTDLQAWRQHEAA